MGWQCINIKLHDVFFLLSQVLLKIIGYQIIVTWGGTTICLMMLKMLLQSAKIQLLSVEGRWGGGRGLTRGFISDEGRGGAYLKLLFKHVGSDDNKIPHQYRCSGDFLV